MSQLNIRGTYYMRYTPKLIVTTAFFSTLYFSACATSYGPRNALGGYEESDVGKDLIEVRFYGNQHTTADKTIQLLLYRCAELALERGFDSFVVIQDQSYSDDIVQNPTIRKPFETRETMSAGFRTTVSPDHTRATTSTSWVGVYVVAVFNQNNSFYSQYKRSRFDAQKIIKDLKSTVN